MQINKVLYDKTWGLVTTKEMKLNINEISA